MDDLEKQLGSIGQSQRAERAAGKRARYQLWQLVCEALDEPVMRHVPVPWTKKTSLGKYQTAILRHYKTDSRHRALLLKPSGLFQTWRVLGVAGQRGTATYCRSYINAPKIGGIPDDDVDRVRTEIAEVLLELEHHARGRAESYAALRTSTSGTRHLNTKELETVADDILFARQIRAAERSAADPSKVLTALSSRSIDVLPDYANILLGDAHLALGENSDAAKRYRRALDLAVGSHRARALGGLIVSLERSGLRAEAGELLADAGTAFLSVLSTATPQDVQRTRLVLEVVERLDRERPDPAMLNG